MKKTKTRIVRIIAAMLCICIMCPCMTAFAMADDANAGIETTAAPEPTTEADSEAEDTEAEELSPEDKLKEYLGSFGLTWDDLMKMLDVDDDSTTGTVVTNGGRLNVRTGGGMDYNVIDQLLCGEQVKVIGRDGDWYQIIVPEKTGYVYSDYLRVIENADTASSDDLMALAVLMMSMMNTTDTAPVGLTPDGNLTLIDDIGPKKGEGQQFITLESKNGNTFYLIIDRDDKGTENVHFLNLVDEADLFALIEDEENGGGTIVQTCTCTDKCQPGDVNTLCPVCRTNMSECTGKEAETTPAPTDTPDTEPDKTEPEQKNNSSAILLIVLLLAGGGGAAYYFLKVKKSQPKTKGPVDLDDYDYGEDEEDDEEYEVEPDDEEAPADKEE